MDNSYRYLKAIRDKLMEPEERRFQQAINAIHAGFVARTGKRHEGFMYLGRVYRPSSSQIAGKQPSLHIDLWPEMDAHLADRAKVDKDLQDIHQLLFTMLSHVMNNDYQEIRDCIPDCLIMLLPPEINQLPRLRSPSFFLRHPREFADYERLLPLMEFYSVTALIY